MIMKRLWLAILGVSETRWTGSGKVQLASGETILYSGLADDNAPQRQMGSPDPVQRGGKEPEGMGTNP